MTTIVNFSVITGPFPGPVRSSSREITQLKSFKFATWNVGTLRGRSGEVIETISRRGIELCCVQEVR